MATKLGLVDAFEFAFGRMATRGGAILIGAYVLFQLLTQVAVQSLFSAFLGGRLPSEMAGQVYPLAVDLPVAVSGAVSLLLVLAGTAFGVVGMRAFYRDTSSFPTAGHTRRLGYAVVVALVVSIVVSVAVTIGFVFVLVPGIFLAVSLVFAVPLVAIEDAGVVEALKGSWSLARGNRIRLFLLGVVVFVLGLLVSVPFTVLSFVSPVASDVGSAVVTGVLGVFTLALLVGAYSQLTDAADGVATDGTPAL
jgi:hypothetical protein